MISIHLNHQDLAGVRFAYSPLVEIGMSLWLRVDNHKAQSFKTWLHDTEPYLQDVEMPYIDAALLGSHFIADFLTPPPISPFTTFEAELEHLRQTPAEMIRKNIQFILKHRQKTTAHEHYLTHPHQALENLISELRLYWERTIAPEWQHISLILEKDILYRARQMALYGLSHTFTDLSSSVLYNTNRLIIEKQKSKFAPDFYYTDYQSDGAGIYLIPTFFKSGFGVSWQITDDFQPIIIYQARGTGLWKSNEPADSTEAMELVLGAGKSRLLAFLLHPSTTGELAHKLEVTAGAVSQHLKGLTQAGLIVSHRQGNHVYHELSERGKKLIALFGE